MTDRLPAPSEQDTRRFYDQDGHPNHAEHALSALGNMHGAPTREMAARWEASARVHGLLALREAQQDLARSNRELAGAMDRLAGEHRARRP